MQSEHIWLDKELYPFEHKYIDLEAGKMHYVDEGEGETLLFVHGTPSWSFLYRDFIKKLSANYRCIAVDHLGFGLSEKNEDFRGYAEDHAKNLTEFIHKMNLDRFSILVHDFGGPIGLAAALSCPEKIDKIVLFNTWLWETNSNPAVQKIAKIINSYFGKFLYLNLNFSTKVLLKKGFSNPKKLSKKVHSQYINAFPSKASRLAPFNIGKSLLASSDFFQEQWENFERLCKKETLVLWGMKDSFINTEYLKIWQARLQNAKLVELNSGHFVQEEKTEDSISEISYFMRYGVSNGASL